jgi:hypothetical protein
MKNQTRPVLVVISLFVFAALNATQGKSLAPVAPMLVAPTMSGIVHDQPAGAENKTPVSQKRQTQRSPPRRDAKPVGPAPIDVQAKLQALKNREEYVSSYDRFANHTTVMSKPLSLLSSEESATAGLGNQLQEREPVAQIEDEAKIDALRAAEGPGRHELTARAIGDIRLKAIDRKIAIAKARLRAVETLGSNFPTQFELVVGFGFTGTVLLPGAKEPQFSLVFLSQSGEWHFLKNHALNALVDGERLALGDGQRDGNADVGGGVSEHLAFNLTQEQFEKIANGRSVEIQLGGFERKFKAEHIQMFKDLFSLTQSKSLG